MRFTRHLDRPEATVPAVVLAACLAAAGAASSCASDDGERPDSADAAPEASESLQDAGADHASIPDAAPFDASPLPVECGSTSPCATALVTTLGKNDTDLAEGFCALLNDGTVACWGANQGGQLGRGEEAGTADNATPARVVGLADVVSLDHTCAIDKTGATWCWGTGPFLQDDSGQTSTERTPVKLPIPPATRVSMSIETACAVMEDGVVCWGANTSGQVAPSESAPWTAKLSPQAVSVPLSSPIRDLVIGKASFVLRDDGVTVSWGANPPLGRVSPLFPDPYPQPIPLRGVSSMDLASDNACAVAGGIGYCWGVVTPPPPTLSGGFHLPEVTNVDRALPEPVVAPEHLVRIATTRTLITDDLGERIVQAQRWCGAAPSGNLYCWGYNASGQAGDGTKSPALEAVKVAGLPGPVADVKTTPEATCALLTSGKVYCWGSDFYGQLGTGELKVPSIAPQEVELP